MVPIGLVSVHQSGTVEASDGFGHPRDSLARVREHVAREHVGDDQFDVIDSDAVVVHVGLQTFQDQAGVPVHGGDAP